MRLALCALVLACLLNVTLDSQPPMESSLGRFPIPPEIGMSGQCNARILATGVVDSAEHEAQEGFAEINGVSLSVHRDGIPAVQLRELRGQRVDLMLRVLEPKTLRRLER
jgi:hypothetical protein